MRELDNLARVLVTDDEPLIADSLAMILGMSGFDARAAYSGQMAIDMARNLRPDMLITDVVMPGITGIETAIQVRVICPSCKVLLFSGQAAATGLLEVARASNLEFEFLDKPVHPTEVIARLRTMVCV